MLLTNPVTNDPRVRREAATLVGAGYQVVVIGVEIEEGHNREQWLDGYRIIRVAHPRSILSHGLRQFKQFSPELYDALRWLYRRIKSGTQVTGQDSKEKTVQTIDRQLSTTYLTKLRADLRTIINMLWLNVALARAALKQHADIYHAHDLDTLFAGYLATRWTGKKLVYDFHELYTEQYGPGVKTALWHWYYSTLEKLLVKRTTMRLTVCDSLGAWLSERYGVNGVVTVRNVPSYQTITPALVKQKRKGVVIYQGLYARDRGLEQLIESARYIEEALILFRGYGDMENQLRALPRKMGVEKRVLFAPPVPMTDLVRTASEADIGMAPFIPVCLNTQLCLPNKLFEYMMAGLAILGTDLPEMRRIILGHNVGAVCNPNDPKDIGRAINELLQDQSLLRVMKCNALRAARVHYNWEIEERRLVQAYKGVAEC